MKVILINVLLVITIKIDLISHQLLITKLKDAGITGNILQVLRSMYMQFNEHVKTPNGIT